MRIVPFCLLALLGLCVGVANAAPETTSARSPEVLPVEENGLRISIPSYQRAWQNGNRISLGASNPTLPVVLQNMTTQPLFLPDEGNSWGNYCLTLQISKINDRVLPQPLVVQRTEGTWFANGMFAQVVDTQETTIRGMPLFLPEEVIKGSTIPIRQDRRGVNQFYYGFPFPNSSAPVRLTMRAVFSNPLPGEVPAWTGKIASPWKDYPVSW